MIKDFVFKDQPNGKCFECKWNNSVDELLHCVCPMTHITNEICIQKRTMVIEQNIYNGMDDDY